MNLKELKCEFPGCKRDAISDYNGNLCVQHLDWKSREPTIAVNDTTVKRDAFFALQSAAERVHDGLDKGLAEITGKEAAALLAHIDSLVAERDALRADAMRYRWLRNSAHDELEAHVEFMDENEDGPTGVWYSKHGHELDAAIDAALESK